MEMMGEDEHDNPNEHVIPEPTGLTRVGPRGESSGMLMRGHEGMLPQAVERHMIVEKKAVSPGNGNLSRHLLSITAAVNAYVVEKGSLVLAIYGSQPGEGASTVSRELAIALSRSPTNNILLIDGTHGGSSQADHFDSKYVESLWSTARGAPIRTVRLTLPRGGAIDLAGLQIDDADDAEVDLRLLPQLFNRLRNVFNVIILDCPPVLNAAGYVSASALADSCLLVVEADRTRVPVVRRAMEEIEAAGGKLQGVVLNKRKHYIPSWIYRRL
jgi:Mrp family chromosome partitioning ATPase